MNSRGYVWLDETVEHTDREEARAKALAEMWSSLHDAAEQRAFARMADAEEGCGYGYEPEPCETCGGDGFLGLDGPRSRRGRLVAWFGCGEDGCPKQLVGIKCPNPNCEDGEDMGPLREAERYAREREEERKLEIEIVEEKLARLGARMMRPYEHWNEDEAYMQWAERDRD